MHRMVSHILISFVLGFFFVSSVSLAKDSSSGCGAGWYILKENSLISSVLRITTNGIFFNATLGMTSGTSNCAKHSIVENDKKAMMLVASHRDSILIDVARGKGEYLMAYANALGCPWQASDQLAASLSAELPDFLSVDVKSPQDFVDKTKHVIIKKNSLLQQCYQPIS